MKMKADHRVLIHGIALGLMLALAGIVVYPRLEAAGRKVVIDTKLESGLHLVMVAVGPTSMPSPQLSNAVQTIRDSLRALAGRHGMFFSTVGVSDHWGIHQGLSVLQGLGGFDEVIIGRNWFNTGIANYVERLGGSNSVPQVNVFLQQVDVDSLPIKRSEPTVLLRLGTTSAIIDFASAGAHLTIPASVASEDNLHAE